MFAEQVAEQARQVAVAQVEVVDREADRAMDRGLPEHPCYDAELLGLVPCCVVSGRSSAVQQAEELVGIPGVAVAFREEFAEVVEPLCGLHGVETERCGERSQERGTAGVLVGLRGEVPDLHCSALLQCFACRTQQPTLAHARFAHQEARSATLLATGRCRQCLDACELAHPPNERGLSKGGDAPRRLRQHER